MDNNLETRLARVEARLAFLYESVGDAWKKTYDHAIAIGDAEEAAHFARLIRNRELDKTDNRMIIDRPEPLSEEWKSYRQALRDITKQPGFPLDINWPVAPDD